MTHSYKKASMRCFCVREIGWLFTIERDGKVEKVFKLTVENCAGTPPVFGLELILKRAA